MAVGEWTTTLHWDNHGPRQIQACNLVHQPTMAVGERTTTLHWDNHGPKQIQARLQAKTNLLTSVGGVDRTQRLCTNGEPHQRHQSRQMIRHQGL